MQDVQYCRAPWIVLDSTGFFLFVFVSSVETHNFPTHSPSHIDEVLTDEAVSVFHFDLFCLCVDSRYFPLSEHLNGNVGGLSPSEF